jgi:Plants and Prokaryotes Conserved (PCC) domain
MAKDSRRIPVEEQCEVLSLIGDVAEDRDGPSLNVHVVLGLSDGTTRDGHLIEGRVFPTLEVVVTENPTELRKVMHPSSGSRSSISIVRRPARLAVRGVWPVPPPGNPCGGDWADQRQERSCLRSE